MVKEKKQAFVEPKYTLSLVAAFLGVAFLGFALLSLTLFILLNWRLGENYLEGIVTLNALKDRLPLILLVGGIVQANILTLILFLLSLLWAHSIAGPIVRFEKFLRLIGSNVPMPEISFRGGDQLHALAQALRNVQVSRHRRSERLRTHLETASRLLEEIDSSPSGARIKVHELQKVYRSIKGN